MPSRTAEPRPRPGPARAADVDLHVAGRIRRRRLMLGLTQQDLAALLGVTFQQAHKYETGVNRVTAGRLHGIAGALGVEVAYFYEELDREPAFAPGPRQRLLLELVRDFSDMPDPRYQEMVCDLARALAGTETAEEGDAAS
jgi:transcriptional regulator with XRE-family HTH domain